LGLYRPADAFDLNRRKIESERTEGESWVGNRHDCASMSGERCLCRMRQFVLNSTRLFSKFGALSKKQKQFSGPAEEWGAGNEEAPE
jgi:hypothetical protein